MNLEHSEDSDLEESTTTWMAWGTVLLVVFIAAFPVYRAIEPGRRADATEARNDELAAQGADLYEVSCSQCHGIDGQGGLAPAFASKEFLLSVTDDQMAQLTAVGVPGSPMSAYSNDFGGPLTSEQIAAVVAYIRSFEEDAPDFPEWRYPLARADLDGNEIYNLACASCHGYDLDGVGEFPALGPGSDAEEEPDARLVLRINKGKDEMPAFAGSLDDAQIDLIVEYLRESQRG